MELNQAHSIIYQHLLDLHRQDPEFRFLLYPVDETKNLSWTENGNYIAISFWKSHFEELRFLFAPIALSIKPQDSTACIYFFLDLDEEDKVQYFENMARTFGFNNTPKEYFYQWEKKLEFEGNNFEKLIDDFIKKDKKAIDAYLKENNSFGSDMNKISDNDFEENIALNESFIKRYLNTKIKRQKTSVLKYLKVENYQGIKSLIINNLPNDAQWIFLTGENGFGKTSVLRAIAKGLLGDEERVTQIDEKTKIFLSIISLDNIYRSFFIQKGIRNKISHYKTILGYGVARFNLTDDGNYGDAYTLFEEDGKLLNIEKLLITADDQNFDKIKTVFKQIIPNLADIKKVKNNGFYEIRYQEKNDNGETFDLVKLNDLAAGYRGIITMIGDMLRRSINDVESFEDIEGIVIIDEFDAHLHPKYQYELPKLLSTVFPKVQFIVSTHSPIPLLGVEPNTAVVLTVNRTKELGITVERLDDDIDISRLSANALLTSDIFGFKSIFARGSTPDTIEPFDDYKDIKEMNELEKRLELKQGFKDLNIKIA